MVWQNLVLLYLSQKWYGSCRACRTGGAAHGNSKITYALYQNTAIANIGIPSGWVNFAIIALNLFIH